MNFHSCHKCACRRPMLIILYFLLRTTTIHPFSIHNWQNTKSSWTSPIAMFKFPEADVSTTDTSAPSILSPDSDDVSRRSFLNALMTGAAAAVMMSSLPVDASAVDVSHALSSKPLETDSSSIIRDDQPTITAVASSDELIAASDAASAAAVDWGGILQKASKKALGRGKAGAAAAVVQVCSLMWLRTAMNYQYRYGGNLVSSLETLWAEGGVARLYQGLPFALVQGPMTRFGDTAANAGILALLESIDYTASLPLPVKTACGSVAAGCWRIFLMPVDTSKTAMQVEGAEGLERLWSKVGQEGPAPLYQGAAASAAATTVGHFPWFLTYNFLDGVLPVVSADDDLFLSLARSAFMGLCAACVSDISSNSLRVIKTTKQTAALGAAANTTTELAEVVDAPAATNTTTPTTTDSAEGSDAPELSYAQVISLIIEKDGIKGLFGRGLQTRLLTNAIQGAVFSVLWRYFQQVGGVQ